MLSYLHFMYFLYYEGYHPLLIHSSFGREGKNDDQYVTITEIDRICIYLSINLYLYLSICLSIYLSIYLMIHIFNILPINPSIHPSIPPRHSFCEIYGSFCMKNLLRQHTWEPSCRVILPTSGDTTYVHVCLYCSASVQSLSFKNKVFLLLR